MRWTDEILNAMIGQRYGHRVVLSVEHKGNHNRGPQVNTRCDCGYVGKTSAESLKQGKAFDCGCHNKRNMLPPTEAAFNVLFKLYVDRAKERGYCFELPRESFKNLIAQPCHYCGKPPAQEVTSKNGTLFYNGVDRQNNACGYTLGNSVPCCGVCNQWKSNFSLENFLEHVAAITHNTARKESKAGL